MLLRNQQVTDFFERKNLKNTLEGEIRNHTITLHNIFKLFDDTLKAENCFYTEAYAEVSDNNFISNILFTAPKLRCSLSFMYIDKESVYKTEQEFVNPFLENNDVKVSKVPLSEESLPTAVSYLLDEIRIKYIPEDEVYLNKFVNVHHVIVFHSVILFTDMEFNHGINVLVGFEFPIPTV